MIKHSDPDIQLMFQVCQKYYFRQMSKVEIAMDLQISRYKVSQLLERALYEGYVNIKLKNFPNEISPLSSEIEKLYGISNVIVANTDGLDETQSRQMVYKATTDFIISVMDKDDVFGICCGKTLQEVVKYIPEKKINESIQIVQLTGGFHLYKAINGLQILYDLSNKFNTEIKMFMTPICVKNEAIKETLLTDETLKSTISYFPKVTLALTGIGSWWPENTSTFCAVSNFDPESLDILEQNNIAGDLFHHLFDKDGNIIDDKIEEKAMSIDIDTLRRIPRKIAVCYDDKRIHAVIGAIKTGLIDVLVIDSAIAKLMIEYNEDK